MNTKYSAIARFLGWPTQKKAGIALIASLLLALTPAELLAHPEIEEQIARLTLALEKEPKNANLWLRRSDLQRQHRQFDLAFADLAQVARLKPGWPALYLARARTFFDAQRPQDALDAAEEFLKLEPTHAEGLLLRARCWTKLGQMNKATAGYTEALRRFAEPPPDLFLEHARLQAALGRFDEALQGLDEAILKLGPAPALEFATIEYEQQRGDFQAALRRATALVSRAEIKEPALALKAELLEQTGHLAEAREAFQRVLAGIVAYPANRRSIDATLQLQGRAQDGLARVQGKISGSLHGKGCSVASRPDATQ